MTFFLACQFGADYFALIIDVGQRGQCRIKCFSEGKDPATLLWWER